MLVGKDIFLTSTPGWHLFFIYPPVAAVLMTPLAFGPYLFWQLAWTVAGVGRDAVGAAALRGAARLEARAGRLGRARRRRADPHDAGLRPGQHVPDGPRRGRPAAALARGARSTSGRCRASSSGSPRRSSSRRRCSASSPFLAGKRRAAITAAVSFFVFTGIGYVVPAAQHGRVLRRAVRRRHPYGLAPLRRQPVAARRLLPPRRHEPARRRWSASASAGVVALLGARRRGALVARRAAGLRRRARRAVHQPRLAAVVDPPLRVDPADGRRRADPGAAALGAGPGRVLGRLGVPVPAAGAAARTASRSS